ncbi:MAG: anaerobic ribonucleoside-triphosphate reductase [Promethearchaeota archaeon]
MSSDKNQDVLEKQLKTLGQKIRIDILKKLSQRNTPLAYSSLKKEVLGSNPNAINFSFHLKTLKNSALIESSDDGYILNTLGSQILKNILSIEQILNDKNKIIMIRTSKYSKEPFDTNKIEKYLIKEGQVEKFLAKQIAKEVEERLSKTNIEYLTTPLMREYINAILLEKGQENIRHKLTRLGTPPFEVFKIFDNNSINSEKILLKLGSDVSEQFLLLNLLPKNLADLYLSGEVILLNLNYWSLRPLGLYVDTDSILRYISNNNAIDFNNLSSSINQINLIINFFDTLARFNPFFSEDIVLGNFIESLLTHLTSKQDSSHLLSIIISQIIKQSHRYYDENSHLSLEFSLLNNKKEKVIDNSQFQMANDFFDKLLYQTNHKNQIIGPLILLDYCSFQCSKIISKIQLNNLKSQYYRNIIFFNKNQSNLLNSTHINVRNLNSHNPKRNRIILDKILINLHQIAENSYQNDNTFFDYLQERLDSVFEFFEYKKDLMKRRLKSSNQWKSITSEFFEAKDNKWIDDSLKSVSFFGFNNAVKTHCGIEVDRIDKSESFAYDIFKFMSSIIREKNLQNGESYIFTQPHNDAYLQKIWDNNQTDLGNESNRYCVRMVRKDSNLPLKSKIELYKKFEKYLDGGSIFTLGLNKLSVEKELNCLINSKLNAFQLEI